MLCVSTSFYYSSNTQLLKLQGLYGGQELRFTRNYKFEQRTCWQLQQIVYLLTPSCQTEDLALEFIFIRARLIITSIHLSTYTDTADRDTSDKRNPNHGIMCMLMDHGRSPFEIRDTSVNAFFREEMAVRPSHNLFSE